jgi:hypothetical protein
MVDLLSCRVRVALLLLFALLPLAGCPERSPPPTTIVGAR